VFALFLGAIARLPCAAGSPSGGALQLDGAMALSSAATKLATLQHWASGAARARGHRRI
jgi:hypothetical protein